MLLEVIVIAATTVQKDIVGLGIGLKLLDLEVGILFAEGFLLLAVVFRNIPFFFGQGRFVIHIEGYYHIVVAQDFKHARV